MEKFYLIKEYTKKNKGGSESLYKTGIEIEDCELEAIVKFFEENCYEAKKHLYSASLIARIKELL